MENTALYRLPIFSSGFFKSIEKSSTPSNAILPLLRMTRSVLRSIAFEASFDDISSSFYRIGDDSEN